MSASRHRRRAARHVQRWGHVVVTGGLVAATYGLWHWATVTERVSAIVLPAPSAVWRSVVDIVQRDSFPTHLRTTATEVLVGFAIGAVTAIVMALVCDHFAGFRRMITPYMVALQAVPKIVLLPLLFIWFEAGYRATTVLVVLVVFFPVYLTSLVGLATADPAGTRLLVSLGASPAQRFRYHRVPSALPLVFTGCKTAVSFAVAAALSGELLGSRHGLGFLIANSGNYLRIDDLYATVVICWAFAFVFYELFEIIDRVVVYWRARDDHR